LRDEHLDHYRRFLVTKGLTAEPSNNKLRDVEAKYASGGHVFTFNKELLCSYDICSSCEAHALLLSVQRGFATSVQTALPLAELPNKYVRGNVDFINCPSFS
jgi:hypothetical protein